MYTYDILGSVGLSGHHTGIHVAHFLNNSIQVEQFVYTHTTNYVCIHTLNYAVLYHLKYNS